MVGAVITNDLDTVKSVRIPQADSPVFSNRDDLLLFIITVDRNNFLVVVRDDAIDDP